MLSLPPVLDVDEARTIREGFETHARAGRPFIVRRCGVTTVPRGEVTRRLSEAEDAVFGWAPDQSAVENLRLRDVVAEWRNHTLRVNVVDSPIPGIFKSSEICADLLPYGFHAGRLMAVVTNRLGYTPIHQDSPGRGGGWMWLAEGNKMWTFLDYRDCDTLLTPRGDLLDLPIEDLLSRDNHALRGRLRRGCIGSTDFVYFPPGCAHRVRTGERSIGLGGYASPVEDEGQIARVFAWYRERGLDPGGESNAAEKT